jgi:membrane protease YdiL (CAAX protease family)
MLPLWLGLAIVLIDFALIRVCFLYTRESSILGCAVAGVLLYVVRLAIVSVTLWSACKFFGVTGASLGIRRSSIVPDFKWSLRICLVVGASAAVALSGGVIVALCLGIRLPPPPELFVQVLGGNSNLGNLLALASLGFLVLTILAPLTEELIYRSLLMPVLTSRIGLFGSIAIASIVFGLLHAIPFGELAMGLPQVVGGLVMATAFSIRWSVTSAMVVHATGNLFVGAVAFIYAELFKSFPAVFH